MADQGEVNVDDGRAILLLFSLAFGLPFLFLLLFTLLPRLLLACAAADATSPRVLEHGFSLGPTPPLTPASTSTVDDNAHDDDSDDDVWDLLLRTRTLSAYLATPDLARLARASRRHRPVVGQAWHLHYPRYHPSRVHALTGILLMQMQARQQRQLQHQQQEEQQRRCLLPAFTTLHAEWVYPYETHQRLLAFLLLRALPPLAASLHTLVIDTSCLGPGVLRTLGESAIPSLPGLRRCRLEGNPWMGQWGTQPRPRRQQQQQQEEEDCCGIPPPGAVVDPRALLWDRLLEALARRPLLECVELPRCGLGGDIGSVLGRLSRCRRLRTLDLSHNDGLCDWMAAFGVALDVGVGVGVGVVFPQLTELRLVAVGLDADGLTRLVAGFLVKLPALTRLALSRNPGIGGDGDSGGGVPALHRLLPRLTYLELASVGLGAGALAALLQAMGGPGQRQGEVSSRFTLDVRGNPDLAAVVVLATVPGGVRVLV